MKNEKLEVKSLPPAFFKWRSKGRELDWNHLQPSFFKGGRKFVPAKGGAGEINPSHALPFQKGRENTNPKRGRGRKSFCINPSQPSLQIRKVAEIKNQIIAPTSNSPSFPSRLLL